MNTANQSEQVSLGALTDAADSDTSPTDDEIIDVYVEAFGGTRGQAVARLRAFVGTAEESRT